jgi:hypothetical protein
VVQEIHQQFQRQQCKDTPEGLAELERLIMAVVAVVVQTQLEPMELQPPVAMEAGQRLHLFQEHQ